MSNQMSDVIVPKSDQINADDLISGPKTITIERVEIVGGQEQPVSIFFKGSPKAYRPCKSMSRVLVFAWGADAKVYAGRSMTIYRDPSVKWGGLEVGGIRISHLTNIAEPMAMALTATKGRRAPFVVKPLKSISTPHPQSLSPFEAEREEEKQATLAAIQNAIKGEIPGTDAEAQRAKANLIQTIFGASWSAVAAMDADKLKAGLSKLTEHLMNKSNDFAPEPTKPASSGLVLSPAMKAAQAQSEFDEPQQSGGSVAAKVGASPPPTEQTTAPAPAGSNSDAAAGVFKPVAQQEIPAAASSLLDEATIGKLQDIIGEHGPKAFAYLVNVKKWLQPGQGLQFLSAKDAKSILDNANGFMNAVKR